MKNFRYVVPNALTLVNLLLGCAAIITVFRGENEYLAGWLIFLAALFDFLDGFAAKLLDAKSKFGIQLDSLADVVSFGVAPSLILFNWIILVLTRNSDRSTFEIVSASFTQDLLLFCSMFFVIASAIRLARFNVSDTNQSSFRGLPTPAAAMVVAVLWLILGNTENESVRTLLLNIYFVLTLILVLVLWMVSNLKMLSLKFQGAGISKNLIQYILILSGLVLIIIFRIEGIFFTLILYLLLSLITGLRNSSKI